ncbi:MULTISPECIES: hypothetical protein [Bradyrhizobium]|uniref:hypothetical protein n=1 Tax=Bradyrhizobium TaxID=374 RepID=UPI0013DE881D|nr:MULTISPECIES: hypothetical protein [Bradyrhizobium]
MKSQPADDAAADVMQEVHGAFGVTFAFDLDVVAQHVLLLLVEALRNAIDEPLRTNLETKTPDLALVMARAKARQQLFAKLYTNIQ